MTQLCRTCGYDLIGLPAGSGVCPECGCSNPGASPKFRISWGRVTLGFLASFLSCPTAFFFGLSTVGQNEFSWQARAAVAMLLVPVVGPVVASFAFRGRRERRLTLASACATCAATWLIQILMVIVCVELFKVSEGR
jgi:hypothetical protein